MKHGEIVGYLQITPVLQPFLGQKLIGLLLEAGLIPQKMPDFFQTAKTAFTQGQDIQSPGFSQSQITGGKKDKGLQVRIADGVAAAFELFDIHEINAKMTQDSPG